MRNVWNNRGRSAYIELKRGWIKCVIEANLANQDLDIRVMNGLL